jgi:hypothetical protein
MLFNHPFIVSIIIWLVGVFLVARLVGANGKDRGE